MHGPECAHLHGHAHDAVSLPAPAASAAGALAIALGLGLHSVMEGLALGAQETVEQGVGIFLAIMAHKGLAAFALGNKLLSLPATSSTSRFSASSEWHSRTVCHHSTCRLTADRCCGQCSSSRSPRRWALASPGP